MSNFLEGQIVIDLHTQYHEYLQDEIKKGSKDIMTFEEYITMANKKLKRITDKEEENLKAWLAKQHRFSLIRGSRNFQRKKITTIK